MGAALAACGADGSGPSGFPSAGAGNVAGSVGVAGAGNTAGAIGSAGAAQAGAAATTGGGGSGGAAQAGSGGSLTTAGAGGASAGAPSGGSAGTGTAGSTGSAGSGGASSIPAVKFVVYIDDYTGSWTSWAAKVDFSKVTHLNLAFFKATTGNDWASVDGQSDADIKAVVDKAHAKGTKVLASLGGGGTDTTVANQYKNPANDDALANNLSAFLTKHNLDGADIDIEKESKAEVGDNYGMFVSKVVAKLRPQGKLVTAASAPYLDAYVNLDTLMLFDFVNIMTYSSNPADYTSGAKHFTDKGVAKTKLTLGVISESGNHSSVANAKAIATLSKDYGGAMLWDLAEDTTGTASVYKALQDSF